MTPEPAIIFLEQLYPFPEADLEAVLAQHPNARELLWVQEEPANMGGLNFLAPRLERLAHGLPIPVREAVSLVQSVHGITYSP